MPGKTNAVLDHIAGLPKDTKLTMTIMGRGLFAAPATGADRAFLDEATAACAEVSTRCGTCALRAGTEANASRLVSLLIQRSLQNGQTFMCHSGVKENETPSRPCEGFLHLKKERADAQG